MAKTRMTREGTAARREWQWVRADFAGKRGLTASLTGRLSRFCNTVSGFQLLLVPKSLHQLPLGVTMCFGQWAMVVGWHGQAYSLAHVSPGSDMGKSTCPCHP